MSNQKIPVLRKFNSRLFLLKYFELTKDYITVPFIVLPETIRFSSEEMLVNKKTKDT